MVRNIYVVANQKGGVGKTTTAVNLSAALALSGRRILLIDMDPQANATSHLGIEEPEWKNVYRVLIGDEPIEHAIFPTDIDRLWLLPSHSDLYGATLELPGEDNWPYRLKGVLGEIAYRFDEIWIDTPPSLGVLTICAMVAGNKVVIPVQCEYFALEGLSMLLKTIERVQRSFNPEILLDSVVMTMYDERTNLSKQIYDELARFFGSVLKKTVIPRNVRLAEAPSFGKTIFLYDIRSRGAQSYLKLAREFLGYAEESAGKGFGSAHISERA